MVGCVPRLPAQSCVLGGTEPPSYFVCRVRYKRSVFTACLNCAATEHARAAQLTVEYRRRKAGDVGCHAACSSVSHTLCTKGGTSPPPSAFGLNYMCYWTSPEELGYSPECVDEVATSRLSQSKGQRIRDTVRLTLVERHWAMAMALSCLSMLIWARQRRVGTFVGFRAEPPMSITLLPTPQDWSIKRTRIHGQRCSCLLSDSFGPRLELQLPR